MRASCSAELIAPTSVFLSSGSPSRSVISRCLSLSTTSSATDSCTSSREPAQQTWPWLKKMPLTMPSTAWSIGASSKTMLAALPPSSSVAFLRVPAIDRAIALPTSVEPVNATLSTSSCSTSARPVGTGAGQDVDHARRQVGLLADLGEEQRGQRGRLGGLQHDRVAAGQCRRDLPRQHQQREVPRDHLSRNAERRGSGPTPACSSLSAQPGVVEEVRGREGHVDVAALLDRLAVVEALEHRELAGALLHQPGDAEEVLARARGPAAWTRPGRTPCARRPPRGRRRPRRPRRPRRAPPRSPG